MIIDPRFTELAEGLIGFSTALKKGERVLIDAFDVPDAMVIALIRAARSRGAYPFVQIHRARITRELSLGAEEAQFASHAEVELAAHEADGRLHRAARLRQHLRGVGRPVGVASSSSAGS